MRRVQCVIKTRKHRSVCLPTVPGTMTFGGEGGMWGKIGQLRRLRPNSWWAVRWMRALTLSTPQMFYSEGRSEMLTGQALKPEGSARERGGGYQSLWRNRYGRRQFPAAVRVFISWRASKRVCDGCSSITSIFISSTVSIRQRPSRRRFTRWIIWCSRDMFATSVCQTGRPANRESAGDFRASGAVALRFPTGLLHDRRSRSGA